MNENLRQIVEEKLKDQGLLQKNWNSLVLAAFDGFDRLQDVLLNSHAPDEPAESAVQKKQTAAYLTSLTVEGFRGIGPEQTLRFNPGPGLTALDWAPGSVPRC